MLEIVAEAHEAVEHCLISLPSKSEPRSSVSSLNLRRSDRGTRIAPAHLRAAHSGYWTSIFSTVTIPAFIVPVMLATTTSALLVALGSADRSARFFNAAAALALPFSSNL
jgi:hypothetical protein